MSPQEDQHALAVSWVDENEAVWKSYDTKRDATSASYRLCVEFGETKQADHMRPEVVCLFLECCRLKLASIELPRFGDGVDSCEIMGNLEQRTSGANRGKRAKHWAGTVGIL